MKFVVECKPDVVFAEVLKAEEIDHSFGESEVVKRGRRAARCLLGVVDEDSGKPASKRLKEFVEVDRFEGHGFVVLGYGSVGFLLGFHTFVELTLFLATQPKEVFIHVSRGAMNNV